MDFKQYFRDFFQFYRDLNFLDQFDMEADVFAEAMVALDVARIPELATVMDDIEEPFDLMGDLLFDEDEVPGTEEIKTLDLRLLALLDNAAEPSEPHNIWWMWNDFPDFPVKEGLPQDGAAFFLETLGHISHQTFLPEEVVETVEKDGRTTLSFNWRGPRVIKTRYIKQILPDESEADCSYIPDVPHILEQINAMLSAEDEHGPRFLQHDVAYDDPEGYTYVPFEATTYVLMPNADEVAQIKQKRGWSF